MTNVKLKPFIKWVGGKSYLVDKVKSVFASEGFDPAKNRFIEPFVGGGGMVLGLAPAHAIIADSNAVLIELWRAVRDYPIPLICETERIIGTISDTESYNSVRDEFNRNLNNPAQSRINACRLLALNRTCFNGLYRVNKQGLFNTPYNKGSCAKKIDKENIFNVSRYLNDNDVTILCCDYQFALQDAKPSDFIYLDPPYYPINKTTAKFTEYTKNPFLIDEQKKLCEDFKRLRFSVGATVAMSNNSVPDIFKMYRGFNIEEISVRRSINSKGDKRSGKECLIYAGEQDSFRELAKLL